jgi:hypothetical protein
MDIDGLYGAPLERFIPERDALARTLRKEGKREDAAEVAGLRKPSVAAWAVNQLVRTQSRSIADLFDAGDALQEAHRAAASGRGDGASLRTASQRERAAVDALMEAARGLLTSDGHELSATIMDRVADTLRAAALDSDDRAKVHDGRLQRELRHVGLGVIAPAGISGPATPRRGGAKRQALEKETKKETKGATATDKGATATDEAKRREQRAENERRKREHAQALKAAREAESKARRRAARADRAVAAAQERRDRAAADLDFAEESLAAARADAQAAADEQRRAQEQLERMEESRRLGR